MDGGQNPDVLCRQNPNGSGIALLENKENDITKISGHQEPGLKDARPQHCFRTEECDLRSDSRVQELSGDNDCGLKDARAQHIFGTQERDLRGDSRVKELSRDHNCGLKDARAQHCLRTQESDLRGDDSRVQELSSDHDCGLKDASASHSVPKGASEPDMDGEGDAIRQKLHDAAFRGIADQKIQRVSNIHKAASMQRWAQSSLQMGRKYRCYRSILAICNDVGQTNSLSRGRIQN